MLYNADRCMFAFLAYLFLLLFALLYSPQENSGGPQATKASQIPQKTIGARKPAMQTNTPDRSPAQPQLMQENQEQK